MVEQRRGLPRTRGGEPWPPAGTLVPESAVPVAAQSAPPIAARRRTGLGHTPAERFAPVISEAAPAAAPSGVDVLAPERADADAPVEASAPAAAPLPAPTAPAHNPAALTARRRVGLGATPAEAPAALAAIAEAAAAAREAAAEAEPAPAPAPAAFAEAEPARVPAASAGAEAEPARVPAASAGAEAEPARAPAEPQASVNQPSDVAAQPAFERPVARETRPFRRSPGKIALATIGVLVVVAAIVAVDRWFLFHTSAGASFLKAFPGTTELPSWAPVGQPLWTQWQHWLNAFFIVLIIKTGWTVRTQKKASAMWQPRKGGKKMSVELFTHLSLDVVWLVNGVVFWVLLFVTGQWIRIVPYSWDFIPNAISAALQYASLWSWPTEDGWTNYNSLQVLTYFATVFLAAPLAAATGFRMSPMWRREWRRLSKAYPVELARKIHFPVMVYFVLFVIVHVVLVLSTGALRNLNHMFWGSDDPGSWAGFTVFVIGIAAIIAAWFVLKPMVMQQIGSLFGKVGR
ncbi:cytochrome b/b6 domain-containing protein [Gryllotalpicola reticulitermitis]|uniref:Cytochrome b/b6 domain-containing protein n=1 Tax=Gryllotalpicola reticulitermitis TaxID=1184153 RepID=A0ABV8Q2I6_9MICO